MYRKKHFNLCLVFMATAIITLTNINPVYAVAITSIPLSSSGQTESEPSDNVAAEGAQQVYVEATPTETPTPAPPTSTPTPAPTQAPTQTPTSTPTPTQTPTSTPIPTATPTVSSNVPEQLLPVVAQVSTGYTFSDGSTDEWCTGYGFFITKNCFVTQYQSAIIPKDSTSWDTLLSGRKEIYKGLGIDLSDYDTTMKSVTRTVTTANGTTVSLSVSPATSLPSYAVLTGETSFKDAVLSKKDITAGLRLDALNFDGERGVIEVKESRSSNGITYISYSGSLKSNYVGCPVIDSMGSVYGIVSDVKPDGGTFIAIESVMDSLDEYKIPYIVDGSASPAPAEETPTAEVTAEVTQEPAKTGITKSTLQQAINDARQTDKTKYTSESIADLMAACDYAQEVVDSGTSTQSDIEAAYIAIREKSNLLVPIEEAVMDELYRVLIIIGVLIAVVLIGLCIVLKKLRKPSDGYEDLDKKAAAQDQKKRNKKETKKTKATDENEQKPVKKQQVEEDEEDDEENDEEEPAEDNGYDDSEDETGLLREPLSRAYLMSEEDGKKRRIRTRRFLIGKSSSSEIDFQIKGNRTISRKHCEIRKRDGSYYLTDLDSLNGTRLNGKKLKANEPALLHNNDTITLSDSSFVFIIEKEED